MPRKLSRRLTPAAAVSLLIFFTAAGATAVLSPGTVSFTSATYEVGEGAGSASVTLTRTGGTDGAVTAKVSLSDVTTAPADYSLRQGETDPSFTRHSSVDGTFSDSLALQPDGKILIGLSRTVRRLLTNGTPDPSFTPPVLNGHVSSVALQPDGKIIIGGGFTVANDLVRNRVARLNADGSLDPTFDGTAGLTFSDSIYVVALTPDGKVMVGGYFTTVSGVNRSHLARLNQDGTLDTGFVPEVRNNVYSMVVQPDGKVIAAGFGLYRYNTDGTVDRGFNGGSSPTNSAELGLALRPDGKLIVGGNFTQVNGTPRSGLVQLNTDGSVDASFNPGTGPDSGILSMDLQPDGKLLIGGGFNVYNGAVRKYMARINTDGSVDPTFVTALGDNDFVYSLRVQRDGRVVIAGSFSLYIRRLFGDLFVTWADGDAADKTVSIPVVNDLLDEPDETATLTLTPVAGGAAEGAITSATLKIVDNDVPPQFTSAPPPQAIKGQFYTHTFTATGSPSPTFSVTSGSVPPGLLLQPSGSLSGTPQSTGTFSFTVAASNGVAPAAAQGVDLVVASGGALQFSAGSYSVAENGGPVTITVNRVGGSAGSATVNYSTSGSSAISGTDFTPASGTLTFADGETSKTFTVGIVNDNVNELDETVNIFLNTFGGSATNGSPTFATLTITNDDPLPTIAVEDVTVTEGDANTKQVFFTITRTGLIDRSVNFTARTADGTAVAGEDYISTSSTFVSISPSASSTTFPVGIVGDTIIEPDKSFFLNISAPSNATITRAQAVGTIKDNDTTTGAPTVQFASQFFAVSEGAGVANVTVTRSGDTSAPTSVFYATLNSSTSVPGFASDRNDYGVTFGRLSFAAAETAKTFQVFITDDTFVEGNETLQIRLSAPTAGTALGSPNVATIRILDNDTAATTVNPVDDSAFFVRQHYRDFLNRDPDAAGLAFWVNEIEKCGTGTTEAEQCREVRRINVSAAFFKSIEFNETGYLVYRLHKAAYNTGERLDYYLFLSQTQDISRGVVVGAQGWEAQLEANKQAFIETFMQYPEFAVAFPASMTPAQFVDALNANTGDPLNPSAGGSLTQGERDQLVADLTSGAKTRAQVLRAVAEGAEFQRRQSSKAFVLMQYFGYLRRAPNAQPNTNFDGYNFWLKKLNDNGGNFISAEMVKAFLASDEYRHRFGQ